jgi:hypothetical protein
MVVAVSLACGQWEGLDTNEMHMKLLKAIRNWFAELGDELCSLGGGTCQQYADDRFVSSGEDPVHDPNDFVNDLGSYAFRDVMSDERGCSYIIDDDL